MSWEVTELQPQKRKKNRFNIITDEGYLLSLSAETIVKHHIRAGMILEEELLEKLRQEDTRKYAKELAADYLGYAPRTRSQVRSHLLRKGIDAESAEAALATMEEYGYIDDAAYAREFARCYSAKLGAAAIRSKLMEKGISREVIDASVEFSREAEREAAAGLVAKLREKYDSLPKEKRRQRIYQALLRKGFSYGDAAELLRDGEDE